MKDIKVMLAKLHDFGIQMNEEDNVAGFLGVHIKCIKDYVKSTQKG